MTRAPLDVDWVVEGAEPSEAAAALVLLHGRGATAFDILSLRAQIDHPGYVFIAPQAEGNTWYPQSFLAPLAENEPSLSRSLAVVARTLDDLEASGIDAARTILLGFSQGACLALESAVRRPRRYGAVAGLTGGLIGPPGTPRDYPGSLAGTPIFLGSGDPDPHVPWERVEESAEVLTRMGAAVTLRRFPGRPHTITTEELEFVHQLMQRVWRDATGQGIDP